MYPYLLFQIDRREARLIKYLLKRFLCWRCRGFYVVTKFMISLKYIHACIFFTKSKYIYSTIKITLFCFFMVDPKQYLVEPLRAGKGCNKSSFNYNKSELYSLGCSCMYVEWSHKAAKSSRPLCKGRCNWGKATFHCFAYSVTMWQVSLMTCFEWKTLRFMNIFIQHIQEIFQNWQSLQGM